MGTWVRAEYSKIIIQEQAPDTACIEGLDKNSFSEAMMSVKVINALFENKKERQQEVDFHHKAWKTEGRKKWGRTSRRSTGHSYGNTDNSPTQ